MNESVYQSNKMLAMIAGLTEETLASREISFLQQFRNTPTALENLDTDASHDGRHSSFFGWFGMALPYFPFVDSCFLGTRHMIYCIF